jgi:hypothetical protein
MAGSSIYGRGWLVFAFVLLAVLVFSFAGCYGNSEQSSTAGRHDVAFTTLGQGVSSDYGRADEAPISNESPPECFAISDIDEYQRIQSLASFSEPLPAVDFSTSIVIAAMQGPKNTGGYAISIMHLSQDATEVRVEVDVVEPDEGSITVQVLTSPYHLVVADRSAFDPRGLLDFTFVDQNDTTLSQEPVQL